MFNDGSGGQSRSGVGGNSGGDSGGSGGEWHWWMAVVGEGGGEDGGGKLKNNDNAPAVKLQLDRKSVNGPVNPVGATSGTIGVIILLFKIKHAFSGQPQRPNM
ncbi:hypothetical protein Tco_0989477 [Tanacetum coccineum]|uniref:Uncharacterized protein n=1 Tax=Tanacetum coccineum TaxID=301880 RepID=A0ABQ5EUH5_9ASTR